MITVKATREGLVGCKTASGYIIDHVVPFVALPSTRALGKFVRVTNARTRLTTLAIVLDVGPWNVSDHSYVFQPSTRTRSASDPLIPPQRPSAECGVDSQGRKTNGAGIDLSERVWTEIGMTDNGMVEWEFIS